MGALAHYNVNDPVSGETFRIQGNSNAANAQIQFATNAANLALAKQQNDWNVQQWERQNQYNSPANQLKLLAEAGINPNAFQYGGSTATELNSADYGVAQSPQLENQDMSRLQFGLDALGKGLNFGDTAMNALYKSQQMEEMRANIAESKQRQRLFNDTYDELKVRPSLENTKLGADTANVWSQHGLNQERARNLIQEREIAKSAWEDTHLMNQKTLDKMKSEIRSIDADTDLKQFEAKFRKQFGIDPKADWPALLIQLALSDPGTMERILSRVTGSFKDLFNSTISYFNPFK